MSDIERKSLKALREMKNRGEISPPHADAKSVDVPEDFWDNVRVRPPLTKEHVNLRIDSDILQFFRQGGRGYQTRIHSVLRSYVDVQTAQPS